MSWFTANHIIVLALAGLGVVLFAIYFRNLARVHASGRWPAVQGKVAESWIEEDATTEEDGTVSRRYAPKVSYRYAVMGVEYQGDRIAFGPATNSSRSNAEKVVARYPKGDAALVYYNPEKPADAVLERSLSKGLLVSGAVVLAVAIYLYIRWG